MLHHNISYGSKAYEKLTAYVTALKALFGSLWIENSIFNSPISGVQLPENPAHLLNNMVIFHC
jgi:hypothetical protein